VEKPRTFNKKGVKITQTEIDKKFPKIRVSKSEKSDIPAIFLTEEQALAMNQNNMLAFYLTYKEEMDDYKKVNYSDGFGKRKVNNLMRGYGKILQVVIMEKEVIHIEGIESKPNVPPPQEIVAEMPEDVIEYYSKGKVKKILKTKVQKLAPIIKRPDVNRIPSVFITMEQLEAMSSRGISQEGIIAYYAANKKEMDVYAKKIYKNLYVNEDSIKYADKNLLREPFWEIGSVVLVGYVYEEII